MCNSTTNIRTLQDKASVTTKANYRLSDGSTRLIIPKNGYGTEREQVYEFEHSGRPAGLELVEPY